MPSKQKDQVYGERQFTARLLPDYTLARLPYCQIIDVYSQLVLMIYACASYELGHVEPRTPVAGSTTYLGSYTAPSGTPADAKASARARHCIHAPQCCSRPRMHE